jgi:hypothetical protein
MRDLSVFEASADKEWLSYVINILSIKYPDCLQDFYLNCLSKHTSDLVQIFNIAFLLTISRTANQVY